MSWIDYTLKDLVTLRQGFALNVKSHHHLSGDNSGLPLLKISDLINGTETLFVKTTIPEQFLVTPSEIIYSRTGQVGLAFMGKTGVVYNNCFKVIPNEKIDSIFLYQWLNSKSIRDYIKSLATGAAQPDLNHDAFKSVKINLPPIPTQKRIASILSAYDDLIENNLKRIKLLEETAQNIYKEWFVHFRFPNYESMAFDAVSGLPVGWEIKKLYELYNTSSGGTPKRDNPNYYEGNIKWFRTNELQDNFLIDSELHISEDALKNSSAKLFPKNTVLMAMYGATIGRLAVLTEEASTNQACCGIIPISEEFGNSYIYYWLLNNREHILSLRMGAAQENISQTIIKDLNVLKPNLNIVSEFNFKVEKINEMKINLISQNQKLKEARDILLPRLMNRTIEV